VIDNLPMLDSERTAICRLLIQIALSERAHASMAVFLSLLALASLYRDGNQSYAAWLKHSALRELRSSAEHGFDAKSRVQHVAAEMLLCTFEVMTRGLIFVTRLLIFLR
jgi:hypothetical protein